MLNIIHSHQRQLNQISKLKNGIHCDVLSEYPLLASVEYPLFYSNEKYICMFEGGRKTGVAENYHMFFCCIPCYDVMVRCFEEAFSFT